IRSQQSPIPERDTKFEARVEKEKRLRTDANTLIRMGRVSDAYAKYEELGRIAPQSPYVMVMLQKLSAIRRQEDLSKQQVAQAKAKFDEGVAFFNQKNYTAAIDSLQASFSINPGSFETADYLKRAQEEQAKDE